MATTSGMYSGLLQTSSELARAEEAMAGAASKGLEEGVKPLQGYLMGVAAKEQERLDQLKADQGLAIDYMNTMADTSGLLGEFEGPIAQFAIETKNKLNGIAKNESLGQYEKAAAYKEAVDAFNKKAMSFSGDQEIMAKLTGTFAKNELSGAVNIDSKEYKIAKAFAHGNFKIKNGKYIIDGVGEVDSNDLKNLYLPSKTIDANKTSATIAALGSATTNRADLDRDLREFALNVGTVETAQQLLVDGLNVPYTEVQGKSLQELQDLIVNKSNTIATKAFIEAKPPALKLSEGQLMGRDTYALVQNSIDTGSYNNFVGGKIAGETITNVKKEGGLLVFDVINNKGEEIRSSSSLNPNNINDRIKLGQILIEHTKGTPSELLKATNTLRALYNQPIKEEESKTTVNNIVDTEVYKPGVLKGGQVDLQGYDFTITNLPTDTITDEEEKFGKKRESRAAGLTPGSTISTVTYENSPLSSKKKISEQEFLDLKSDFEFTYKDYNEQNLAKFRQDKEGLSDKQIRLRQLDAYIAQNVDNNNRITNDMLKTLGVTEKEKEQLKGIKNITVEDLLRQLYVINSDSRTYNSLLASIEPNRDFED